jgi:uncharacterized protein YuzE
MRVTVDREEDALYFRLNENAIAESEEVRPGVILDFNSDGAVVEVEFLGLKDKIPQKELSSIHFEAG